MEQKFIGFVKFHGFYLGLRFLRYAYECTPSIMEYLMEEPRSFGFKTTLAVACILPLLWCVQGLALMVSVFNGYPRSVKLIKYAGVGIFGLEVTLLLAWTNIESTLVAAWIIFFALGTLYGFYVLRILEQMFVYLEKKRQKAVAINAIVGEGGDQSKLVPKQDHLPTLPELHAMGVIQALRKLFKGRDKKLGDRPIVEVMPVNATETI